MDWNKVIEELDAAADRGKAESDRRSIHEPRAAGPAAAYWVLASLADALRKGLE